MTKKLVVTGFSVSGIVLGLAFVGFGLRVLTSHAQGAGQTAQPAQATQGEPAAQGAQRGQGRGQRGPATPPAPCGPNIEGSLGTNTAKDSRCFELRMYTVDPSRDGV